MRLGTTTVGTTRARAARLLGVGVAGAVLATSPSAVVAAPSAAEAAVVSAPGSAGRAIDDDQLAAALQRVRRAGGVGVVARADVGGDTWRGAAGFSQLRPNVPARPGARFRAASVTKPLVAVLALQLVDRGTWTLDTTVGDVLPRLWPRRSAVTIEQLLSHTSGMPDYLTPLFRGDRTPADILRTMRKPRRDGALVRVAKREPYLFEPGTDFAYSNTDFVVAGMMLRAETGSSVRRLMERRIFGPADMTRSTFAVTPAFPRPRLQEYAGFGERQVEYSGVNPTIFSSAGALISTARDLNRFQRALGRGELVSTGSLQTMRSVIGSDPDTGLEYGLGSYRLPDPCNPGGFVYGHDGASLATLTYSFASPEGARVTISATGRRNDRRPGPDRALSRFAFLALAQACPDAGPGRSTPRLPAPDARLLAGLRR